MAKNTILELDALVDQTIAKARRKIISNMTEEKANAPKKGKRTNSTDEYGDIVIDANEQQVSSEDLLIREGMYRKSRLDKPKFTKIDKDGFEVEDDTYVPATSSAALSINAKMFLELYLKRMPQYKSLDQQIKLLQHEKALYQKAGKKEFVQRCDEMLKQLNESQKQFLKLYKPNDYQEENKRISKEMKNSEVLRELKAERSEIESTLGIRDPKTLISRWYSLKKLLGSTEEKIEDFDTFLDEEEIDADSEIESIEDVLNSAMTIRQQFNNICGIISDYVDNEYSPAEISKLAYKPLLDTLLFYGEKIKPELTELKSRLSENKYLASKEVALIRGSEDISNLIFNMFDLETEPEVPKELLAASNIEFVKAIAYKQISRLNLFQFYDDAIGFGNIGLSQGINAWHSIQKTKDSPVSFSGFAYKYIKFGIKRGLLSLGYSGRVSGSVMATLMTNQRKQLELFYAENPELKDLPTEMVEGLVDGLQILPKAAITESGFNQMIGGEQDGGSGHFQEMISDENSDAIIEAGLEFQDLLTSLKTLFSLFKTKVNKVTGEEEVTDKKLFDYYDYRIFCMRVGIERKKLDEGQSEPYTQQEIANILTEYKHSLGYFNQSFKQEAISDRWKKIMGKLEFALSSNPKLRMAIDYLYNSLQASDNLMKFLSENEGSVTDGLDKSDEASLMLANKIMKKTLNKVSDYRQFETIEIIDGEFYGRRGTIQSIDPIESEFVISVPFSDTRKLVRLHVDQISKLRADKAEFDQLQTYREYVEDHADEDLGSDLNDYGYNDSDDEDIYDESEEIEDFDDIETEF